jgi:hypothetical protein
MSVLRIERRIVRLAGAPLGILGVACDSDPLDCCGAVARPGAGVRLNLSESRNISRMPIGQRMGPTVCATDPTSCSGVLNPVAYPQIKVQSRVVRLANKSRPGSVIAVNDQTNCCSNPPTAHCPVCTGSVPGNPSINDWLITIYLTGGGTETYVMGSLIATTGSSGIPCQAFSGQCIWNLDFTSATLGQLSAVMMIWHQCPGPGFGDSPNNCPYAQFTLGPVDGSLCFGALKQWSNTTFSEPYCDPFETTFCSGAEVDAGGFYDTSNPECLSTAPFTAITLKVNSWVPY